MQFLKVKQPFHHSILFVLLSAPVTRLEVGLATQFIGCTDGRIVWWGWRSADGCGSTLLLPSRSRALYSAILLKLYAFDIRGSVVWSGWVVVMGFPCTEYSHVRTLVKVFLNDVLSA